MLALSSIPEAIAYHKAAVGGFTVAAVLIGMGQGGISAVVYPLIGKLIKRFRKQTLISYVGDQIPMKPPQLVHTKGGGMVVTDRTLTVQYAFNVYYWYVLRVQKMA